MTLEGQIKFHDSQIRELEHLASKVSKEGWTPENRFSLQHHKTFVGMLASNESATFFKLNLNQ